MPYRGDVRPQQAWTMLGEDHDAVLVDVRTRAEWTFVGVPDLTALGKTPLSSSGKPLAILALTQSLLQRSKARA